MSDLQQQSQTNWTYCNSEKQYAEFNVAYDQSQLQL
jgi:hypothetical protein